MQTAVPASNRLPLSHYEKTQNGFLVIYKRQKAPPCRIPSRSSPPPDPSSLLDMRLDPSSPPDPCPPPDPHLRGSYPSLLPIALTR